MNIAESISQRIKHMRKGHPFTWSLFEKLGSRAAIDKTLSRLVQAGALERVIRGVYMRPKESQFIGRVRPSPVRVMEVVTRAKGEVVQVHGAEAVRRFGLSTQMQVQPVYYTSGSTREIRVGQAVIRLKHMSWERLQQAGTKVGLALTALHYLGRNQASGDVVSQIVRTLNQEELKRLLTCKMPGWMQLVLDKAAKEIRCHPTLTYPQQTKASC